MAADEIKKDEILENVNGGIYHSDPFPNDIVKLLKLNGELPDILEDINLENVTGGTFVYSGEEDQKPLIKSSELGAMKR